MQSSYLINHSLELRVALSIATAVVLFAIVRLAFFIDETLTKRQSTDTKRETRNQQPVLTTACAAAR
ncbi:hypothetical protein SAMN05660652_02387 [Propionivibrio dicarboxylicus]|uniref:Uncharacterized protein n=2 Tax=Propionivibrio dicarboxylicus TaxID=83767 RepID=A0A1G8FPK9_9RHOO|nr:hypothetical protein SAMN05660652_02387 [Propionivibrio dicarboxylicus]